MPQMRAPTYTREPAPMLIHELNATECEELLKRETLGRLACSRDGQPYVVPIHFSYDPDHRCLYAFSTVGQKIAWMRENPKVCVEIEEIGHKNRWTTVLVFGRYEEINDSFEEAETRRRAWERFQHRPEWWFPAAAKLPSREHHAMVIYRILIDRLTGRRAARNGP
jgi:nitroimidazol reductase NimA-like FMN-containing flavoprotein (pyridoxamine 5'-phosphate oxidase superfamily)